MVIEAIITNIILVVNKVKVQLHDNCTAWKWNNNVPLPTQVDKMRAELANLNDCAVPFLSRAAANLCWYYYTVIKLVTQERLIK